MKQCIAIYVLAILLVSCSQQSQTTDLNQELAGKTPQQAAEFVFDRYGCNSCHVAGNGGKLGFTDRGESLRANFEGCVNLLTAMNVMAQIPKSQWTAEEKTKNAHFQEYGCTFCHQITPGKMGLTPAGEKLATLHLSCPEVQTLMSRK